MAKRNEYHYYRIYDDREQFNYIRTSLKEQELRKMLKQFEKKNQEYYNTDFLTFLKQRGVNAGLIEVTNVYY